MGLGRLGAVTNPGIVEGAVWEKCMAPSRLTVPPHPGKWGHEGQTASLREAA